VVGLGRLGTAVARIMRVAFGMKLIAWSENLTQERANEQARKAGLPETDEQGNPTIRAVSREEVFRLSDVVTVHLVLSDRSRGLIRAADLESMKKTAFFVNTSRGPLVVEQDLLRVLMQGRIAGAGLDVFDLEPLPSAHTWRVTRWGEDGKSEVLLAPHMGYVEKGTFEAWYRLQAENIERWLKGEPLDTLIEAPKQ
jgi:phosphoglycerate dehydrogenase-like enzyme